MTSEPEQLPYRHLVRAVTTADRIPQFPPGITIDPFDPARDLAQIYAVLAPTYDEVDDGMKLEPFAEWQDILLGDGEFSREAVFLARTTSGELVGLAICWSSGFIYDLAVASDWRKRGIAECLLRHVFAHFAVSGVERVALKVTRDNPTGAERLYTKMGFTDLVEENPD